MDRTPLTSRLATTAEENDRTLSELALCLTLWANATPLPNHSDACVSVDGDCRRDDVAGGTITPDLPDIGQESVRAR
jgi:hypothetical protein